MTIKIRPTILSVMEPTFEHFDPFADIQSIDFSKILEMTRQCSFFEYLGMGMPNSELHLYFDNLVRTERFIYTLYFDQKSLKISRCTGWDGKKFTKGGGNMYKVADVKAKGRKDFDKYMTDFCMKKYGYERAQVLSSIKY